MVNWLVPDSDKNLTAADYREFRTELVSITDLTEDDVAQIEEMEIEEIDGTVFERGKSHDAVNVKLFLLAEEAAERRDSLSESAGPLRESLDEQIDSLLSKDNVRLTTEQKDALQSVAESMVPADQ